MVNSFEIEKQILSIDMKFYTPQYFWGNIDFMKII